jgi:hypothetical protein
MNIRSRQSNRPDKSSRTPDGRPNSRTGIDGRGGCDTSISVGSSADLGRERIAVPDPHEPPLWIAFLAIAAAAFGPLALLAVSHLT